MDVNKKLDDELCKKYSKIFAQRHLPMTQTCMCWGIATGDGWYDLIDKLCHDIQEYVDKHKCEQVEAVQVKEKFGGLRFYVNSAPDEIYDMIHKAEAESYKICELCGSHEGVTQTKGWITSLCKKCMKKRKEAI